ncbi:MAG: fibronectin type III domain-containing protein [Bacteroidales bacterium]|nr:fibronectin type III domain-containing protein [Bacteroidales bacterium]
MKKLLRFMLLTALCVPMSVMAQTPTTATEIPFNTGFENADDDTNWRFNNVGNGWYIGSATNNTSGGSRALYISNTNGSTYAYDPSVASLSYAYCPFNFETAGQYIIEFDWKNNGMASGWGGMTSCFNLLYPYLIPGNVDLTIPALEPDDYAWTPLVQSYLGNATTWQHLSVSIDITTPGVYNLAFVYYCFGMMGGGNPPAAIDNIHLTRLGCMQPTALTIDSVATSEIGVHWIPGGEENDWIVRADGGEWLEIYDTSYLFTNIAAAMLHTLDVAALCSNGDTSLATSITQRTDCGIISSYPWRENFTGFSNMASIPCWTHLGAGAYRFQSGEMELRPMGSTAANIMATPTIANLSQLELTFTTHPEGEASGSLTVGYVTGPDASYVFTPLATYSISEWVDPGVRVEKTVTFSDAPDTARIAFRHNPNSSNFYWYIDNIDLHQLPQCVRPSNFALTYADENNIELSWSDINGSGTTFLIYYRQSDSIDWNELTVTDTTVMITNLEPNTTYEVRLSASCENGSSSPELTGTFMTACADINIFPYEEGFDNGSAFCWQVFSMNGTSSDNWVYTTGASQTHNFSIGAYASSYNEMESCNEWLVSPAIELSEDVSNYTLSWYSFARAWLTHRPRIEVKISTAQEITQTSNNNVALDTTVFSTTLYAEDLEETNYVKHSVSLSQFAGQTIHIAFVRRGHDDDLVNLDDISIYAPLEPSISLAGPASPVVGLATTYRAILDEGVRDSLSYTWSSTAANAGSATMTLVDSATVTLLYSTTTPDTLKVIAVNSFGSDTAILLVNPLVTTYTGLPYSTGFEPTDDIAWTLANDVTNIWYIDTAVHSAGSRALYISDDNGLHNNYDDTASSYSYAYKAFNLATAGQYGLEFDWRGYGEGTYDNLNVYLVPLGTAIVAGTDAGSSWTSLSGLLNAASSWQHFSSVFNLTVPGVYNLVFAWKNDYMLGSDPAAAIDNFSLVAISCEAPASIAIDTLGTDMARLHWSGSAAAWEVTVDGMTPVIVADTFYTVGSLQPATAYTVYVRAICGSGDTSLYASTSFTTDCVPSSIPFNYDFPGSSLSVCWTNSLFSPYPATSWSEGAGTNHRITSVADYIVTPADDWLITPVIDIPAADTASLELIYFVNGYPNNNYTSSSANYEVLVSPTGGVASSFFTDTLVRENNLNSTAFMRRSVHMSQYAGQSIRIAFRNVSTFNGRVGLSEVSLRRTREPLYTVQGPNAVWVNAIDTFAAVYQEGDLNGMAYTWTSTMAAAGRATLYGANTDTLSIIYNAMGIDTLTFVAHNTFGSDTIVTHVTVMDLAPVTTFPYSTGFEPTDADNMSWIALNGTNAWKLGNAASNSGSQAYYISNDNGVTNAYNLGANTRSYLYRAFDISDTGSYAVRFDWNAKGESNFDYLRVWLVHDTAFHVQANSFPVSSISSNSALATATIPGWIAVGGKLNLSNGWSTETDTVAVASTGRYHLVFLWANDGSLGTNPPAAIDNVEVWNTTIFCATPIIDSVYADETEIYFSYSGEANEYEVAIVEGEWNDTSLVTYHSSLLAHTFSSLTPATQYSIGVRAVCGEDNYSDWMVISVTTVEHPCYAPSDVTATDITLTTATIAWTPGEEGQTDFQIRYSTAGDTLTRTVTQSLTHTLTGLFNNTDYSVAVRAVCGEGKYSDWSAPVTFRTLECAPVLGVTVTDITSSSAVVRWNSNGSGAYQVAYGYQGMINDNAIQNVSDTVYAITGLEENTNYSVHVRTVCAEGVYSSWTDETPFTTARETGIDDISGARISLYPNPASSTVTLTGIDGEATVTVVDMNGKVISEFRIQNSEFTFDVSGMAQGAYFVRITGERINAIRKLIVR